MEIRDCDAENLWRVNDVTHCKIEICMERMRIDKCFGLADEWDGVAIPNSDHIMDRQVVIAAALPV